MTEPNSGWQPSASTYASTVGGSLALLIVGALDQFAHIHFGAVYIAALTTVLSAGLGYFFEGGRK